MDGPLVCVCGAEYRAFRTGLTFSDVRQMMRVGSNNPNDWRNKRRHGVLGYWRELKLQLWHMEHGECTQRLAS